MSLTLVASFVLVARITAQVTRTIDMVTVVGLPGTVFIAWFGTSFTVVTTVAF